MESLIYIFALFAVVALVKATFLKNYRTEKSVKEARVYNYGRKDYLMTRSEYDFFMRLNQIFQEQYHIFPQVHLSSVLDGRKIKGQNWNAAFRHINSKSVDFVMCDKQYAKPLIAIELDDWSHSQENRQKRDAEVERIFLGSKMPLARLSNISNLTNLEIESKIKQALSNLQ